MRLNYIELQNHGSFKDYTRIILSEGITGVIGEFESNPRKSNGSGKTTVLSSIVYSLYGKSEFDKVDELVNDQNPDGEMFTALDFNMPNGNNYKVIRGRKKSKAYLDFYENNNRRGDDTTKIDTTQNSITEVIGMDYDMFTASIFFEQNNLDKFINAEPSDRRKYIDKVLGLQLWRSSYKEAFDFLKNSKGEKKTTEINIVNFNELIRVKKEEIKDKIMKEAELLELETEKKFLDDKMNSIKETSILLAELSLLESNEITHTQNIYNFNSIKEEHLKTSETKKLEQVQYEKELSEINYGDYTAEREQLIKDSESLSDKAKVLQEKIYEARSEVGLIAVRTQGNNEKIDKMLVGECPTCLSSLTKEESENAKNSLLKDNEEIATKKEKFKETELTLTEEKSKISMDQVNLNGRIASIDKYVSDSEKRTHWLGLEILNRKNNIDGILRATGDIDISINEEVINLNNVTNRTKELELKLPKNISDSNIDDLKVRSEVVSKLIKDVSFVLGVILQKENEIKGYEDSLEINKQYLLTVNEDIACYKFLASAFKDIPTTLFKESISAIESTANSIIEQILPEIQTVIYEDVAKKSRPIMISFEVKGKKRSYKRLSGGEKTVVNIGLRLGFSQVIMSRAQTELSFIGMDEPFGQLDEENKSLVQTILAKVSKWFSQILVISHDTSIKDFPNIIKIIKDDSDNSRLS